MSEPLEVLGTGIDLVENARMADALAKWGARFKDRIFVPAEQAYCEASAQPESRYAARFAVKEAVAKALTTGIGRHLSWLDMTVERDGSGAPTVVLSPRALAMADARGVVRIHVSIAHTRHHAVASALILGRKPA